MSATCSSCGAPIFWAVTEKGNRMPLNAKPDPMGMFIVLGALEEGGPLRLRTVDEKSLGADVFKRYTSHFASCPAANKHRRKR